MTIHSHWLHAAGAFEDAETGVAWWWSPPANGGDDGGVWLIVHGEGPGRDAAGAARCVVEVFDAHWLRIREAAASAREALERCATQAGTELAAQVPGAGASMAALAVEAGTLHLVRVGRCVAKRSRSGRVQEEAGGVDPNALLGRGGTPVLQGPWPVSEADMIVLASASVTENLDDGLIGEAGLLLESIDAAESLCELARKAWATEDLVVAVVRLTPPNPALRQTGTSFVERHSGASAGQVGAGRTMALGQAPPSSAHPLPARSSLASGGAARHTQPGHQVPSERGAELPDTSAKMEPESHTSPGQPIAAPQESAGQRAAAGPPALEEDVGAWEEAISDPARVSGSRPAAGTAGSTLFMSRDALDGLMGAAEKGGSGGGDSPKEAKPAGAGLQAAEPGGAADADAQTPAATSAGEAVGSTLFMSRDVVEAAQAARDAVDADAQSATHFPQGAGGRATGGHSRDTAGMRRSPDTAPIARPSVDEERGAAPRGPDTERIPHPATPERTDAAQARGGSAATADAGAADAKGRSRAAPSRERASTIALGDVERAALMRGDTAHIPRPGGGGRRKALVALLVLIGLVLVVVLYRLVFAGADAPETPADDAAAEVDAAAVAPVDPPEPSALLDERIAPAEALPPWRDAAQGRAPDGVHVADRMPWYTIRVEDERGRQRELRVDAHEVLGEQLRHVRRNVPDLELVHANTAAALYRFQACAGFDESPPEEDDRPACASPESAEAYCNAVGRRLPSAEDWQALLRAEPGLVAPGHARMWRVRDDGPAPVRTRWQEALVGVFDGYAEILQADASMVASGDLPLLRGVPGQTDPTVIETGLLRALRARTLSPDEIPRLGFRCVTDGAPDEAAPSAAQEAVRTSRALRSPARAPDAERSIAPHAQRTAGDAEAPSRAEEEARRRPDARPDTRPAARPGSTPEWAAMDYDLGALRGVGTVGGAGAGQEGRRLPLTNPVYLPVSIEEFERQVEPESTP